MECIQYIEDNSIYNGLPQYSYTTMLDEEELGIDFGWNKDTVRFVINNCEKIKATVRKDLRDKYRRTVNDMDVEDIYVDILNYVYKYDDYDIEKARKRSEETNSTTILSLEAYVFGSAVKNCIKRYIRESGKERIQRTDNYIQVDDKEISLIEKVADESSTEAYAEIENDIRAALKMLECKRYRYGTDIYLIIYLKFRTVNDESFNRLLDVIGINHKLFSTVERQARCDIDFINLLRVFTDSGKMIAIEMLREYIHSLSLLDMTIDRMNSFV